MRWAFFLGIWCVSCVVVSVGSVIFLRSLNSAIVGVVDLNTITSLSYGFGVAVSTWVTILCLMPAEPFREQRQFPQMTRQAQRLVGDDMEMLPGALLQARGIIGSVDDLLRG